MKRILQIACVLMVSVSMTYGQEVQFQSRPFELGVRCHLGVDTLYALTSEQLDTITELDLSQLDITDISDVCNVPHVKNLNLRYNHIDDVSPLALLDSLQRVDLSNNSLKSINALSFASSKEMMVDVSFNNIIDFSCFNSLTPCRFTIEGMRLQTDPNVLYFHVGPLYCDGSLANPVIYYRVNSNMPEEARLQCREKDVIVPTDGTYLSVEMEGGVTASSKVLVSNGIESDSTFLVTYTPIILNVSETRSIETGLPGDYTIKYISSPLQGSLIVEDNTIVYTASESFEKEDIFFSYYQGSTLRGFSKVTVATDITHVNTLETAGGRLIVSKLNENEYHVSCHSTELMHQSVISFFDPSGKQIASKQVDSRNGIETTLSLSTSRHPVLIVQVVSGQKKWIEKLITRQAR